MFCLVLGLFCYYHNVPYGMKCNMSFAQYGKFWLFIGSSVFLSTAVFFFSHIVDNTFFAKIGAISMPIYLLHPFFRDVIKAISRMFCITSNSFPLNEIIGIFTFMLTAISIFGIRKFAKRKGIEGICYKIGL